MNPTRDRGPAVSAVRAARFETKPDWFQQSAPVELDGREFERIRLLAHERFGLELRQGKEGLVAARLAKFIRRDGHSSFSSYVDQVLRDSSGRAMVEMIDALTTNHTSFLRERAHFDFLCETVLPEITRRDRLEFWCAASSTGEEPYTLACAVLAWLQSAAGRLARQGRPGCEQVPWIRILATDISTQVLDRAARGVYSAEAVRGLPEEWLRAYFLRGSGRAKGLVRVKPEVARLVEFRRLNLIEPFTHPHAFPVVFCRNVMIYFDRPTQQRVVNALSACLEPGGYLFVGHSESLQGIHTGLDYVRPAVYRRPAPLVGRTR